MGESLKEKGEGEGKKGRKISTSLGGGKWRERTLINHEMTRVTGVPRLRDF